MQAGTTVGQRSKTAITLPSHPVDPPEECI